MTKKEAFHVLGLPASAGWESVKKRQRELVKTYHPDNFQDAEQAADAHHKMADINRAVQYLKKLHRTGVLKDQNSADPIRRSKPNPSPEQKPTTERERPQKPEPPPTPPKSDERKKRETAHTAAQMEWLKTRKSTAPSMRELDKQFFDHRQKTLTSYANVVQESVFTRFFASKGTGLGVPDHRALFERYVEFRKIQNQLFYAINRPVNVVLKYSGLLLVVTFIIQGIMGHYYQGRIVFQEDLYYAKLGWLIFGFCVLSLSDLCFRYAISYRYGRLDHPFYRQLMKTGVFTGRMGQSFQAFLVLKYFTVLMIIKQYLSLRGR